MTALFRLAIGPKVSDRSSLDEPLDAARGAWLGGGAARSILVSCALIASVVLLVSQAITVNQVLGDIDTPLVTDLDRDLLGAEAVNRGLQPYTTLGELKPDLPTEWAQTWVAHSPVSIVMARVAGVIGDRSQIVALNRWVSLIALLGLVWFLIRLRSRNRLLLLAAFTVVVWAPTISDLRWVQAQGLIALGLAAVLTLYTKSQRWWALTLLGVLVAWKPWLAFLALFLPGSSSPWRDASRVGIVSIGLTMAVLPWAGGWDALRAWLFEAMPTNTELSRQLHTGVLSFTADVSLPIATTIYVASVIVAVVLGRRTLGPQVWPALGALTHLAYGPLVWDHYWLAVLPVVCWPLIGGTREPLVRWSLAGWLVLSALSHHLYSAFDWPGWVSNVPLAFLASVPVGLGGLWLTALRRSRNELSPNEAQAVSLAAPG
jgi:hypothetical protein